MIDFSQNFFYLGLIITLYYFLKIFRFIVHLFYQKKVDLKARYYNKNTWAIVTGASDGIGKEFSYKMASLGFNVCLMARNKDKTEKVSNDIQKLFPNVHIKCIICDFCYAGNEDFITKIKPELIELQDVGILINNVGMGLNGFFIDSSWEEMRNLINVNCMSIVLMTKLLSSHFLSRDKPSLIINLSSYAKVNPTAFLSVYGASKSFDDYFSRVMDYELSPKIDILSFTPLFVSTALTGFINKFGAISTKEAVEGVLKEIGYSNQTFGHWKHQILGVFLGYITSCENIIKFSVRNKWVLKKFKKEFESIITLKNSSEKYNKKF